MRNLDILIGTTTGKKIPHWDQKLIRWSSILSWPDDPAETKESAVSYVLGKFEPTGYTNEACRTKPCPKIHRLKEAVVSRSAICLDFDKVPNAVDGAMLIEALGEYGWEALVHTTASSKPTRPKYRVVIPLQTDIDTLEYAAIARWLLEDLGHAHDDQASTFSWHFMYRPSGDAVESWHLNPEGGWLDPAEFLDSIGWDRAAAVEAEEAGKVGSKPLDGSEGEPSPFEISEARRRLDAEVEGAASREEGARNSVLFAAMCGLWGYVLGGCLDEDEMVERMRAAAEESGIGAEEFDRVSANACDAADPLRPENPFEAVVDGVGGGKGAACSWEGCSEEPGEKGLCPTHHEQREIDKNRITADEVMPTYDKHAIHLDIHIARRLAFEHLQDVRAIGSSTWAVWNGKMWEYDDGSKVQTRIHDASLAISSSEEKRAKAQVKKDGDHKAFEARMRSVYRLLMSRFLSDMQKMVRAYLGTSPGKFDGPQTRDFLNCRNGVVDLRTGELGPHRKDLYFTKVAGAKYKPGATHEDWDKALMALEPEVVKYLQKRIGQSATGYPSSGDIITFLVGGGENGKSTHMESIKTALGDYFSAVPKSIIVGEKNRHDSLMFELKGVRLAVIEELPRGRWLDSTALKDVAGTGTLKARRMRETLWEYWTPTHCLIVASNYDPKVTDTDHGTWRRLEKIGYDFTFDGSDPDRPRDAGLRDRLQESKDGQREAVLAWIVEGAMRSFDEGLSRDDQPAAVKIATENWKLTGNPINRFANEFLTFDPASASRTEDVYEVYAEWSRKTGQSPSSDQNFWDRLGDTEIMRQPGVEKVRVRPTRYKIVSMREIPAEKIRLLTGVRLEIPEERIQSRKGVEN